MNASELKKEARESLRGKWGKVSCIFLTYYILDFILNSFLGNILSGLLYYIIYVPLLFGLIISFMKLKRNKKVKIWDFIKDGLSKFGKAWSITLYMFLKLLLPIVCLIICLFFILSFLFTTFDGIVAILFVAFCIFSIIYIINKSLLYVLSYNIGYDNPELPSKNCVSKSAELMKGNRIKYLLLEFSFIGWSFALGCTVSLFSNLGILITYAIILIGTSFLTPYMQIATVCFYEKVAKIETINAEPAEKNEK